MAALFSNGSLVCNLKFFSSHIIKSRKKQMQLRLIIYFFKLDISKILSFQHLINGKITEILHTHTPHIYILMGEY